jgi:perosamine synthetase
MQALLDRQIATRRGIMCIHREQAYENQPWRAVGPLDRSERAQDKCILLPLYHQLEYREREFIAGQLRAAITSDYSPEGVVDPLASSDAGGRRTSRSYENG